jgi:UDP-N-acetylglucosamine--N-acetylmuramyl-(pentapeptide) pyrophosphoryl-undecaprenol N-acetylglucosamine transferase
VTGGGTGGHVYPALAVAEALRRDLRDLDVLYVGARGGLEERVVPARGLPFVGLPVRGLVRKRPHEVLLGALAFGQAEAMALHVLRRFRPHLVLGTGGYAAGPVGLAAILARVPLALHEQNAVPGVTNRFLARFAALVFVPTAEAARRLPRRARVVVAPNPVRPELRGVDRGEARRRLGLPPEGPVVVCVAGSRGSAVFVRLFGEWLPHLGRYALLFVSGPAHHAEALARLGATPPPPGSRVVVVPYVEAMGDAWAAADLVVARAGAMTLAEMAAVGRPAVLIPSPHVTHRHQEANARVWERAGAAVVLPEAEADGRRLAEVVAGLLGRRERLEAMAAAARRLGEADGLGVVVRHLRALLHRDGARAREGGGR